MIQLISAHFGIPYDAAAQYYFNKFLPTCTGVFHFMQMCSKLVVLCVFLLSCMHFIFHFDKQSLHLQTAFSHLL